MSFQPKSIVVLKATIALLARVAFTSWLLIAPANSSYGADTPSIYNQLIAQAAMKPANWREQLDTVVKPKQ